MSVAGGEETVHRGAGQDERLEDETLPEAIEGQRQAEEEGATAPGRDDRATDRSRRGRIDDDGEGEGRVEVDLGEPAVAEVANATPRAGGPEPSARTRKDRRTSPEKTR